MNRVLPELSFELLADAGTALPAHTLGLLCYGEALGEGCALPCAQIDLPVLGAGHTVCEAWRSSALPRAGQSGALRYREDGELLFGCLALPEERGAVGSLRELTRSAYAQAFALLDRLGYAHLVRCWNYLADINGVSGGLERYRQFNVGRHEGFELAGRAGSAAVPAACALGTTGGPLVVAFLASRHAPLALENPRQVPAYEYPADYGPRAPTFARATLLPGASGETLFVSGTASIVGHRTMHEGDAAAQTAETLTNLQALLAVANARSAHGGYALDGLALKVYVRHRADLPAVQATLNQHTRAPAVFLLADVCRDNLLVEIEACAMARGGSAGAAREGTTA